MGFSESIANEVFVKCGRHCCLCGTYAGQKMELHHIKQAADGGDDSIENCIPLCFNCHAEVKAYNPRHPKGRKFTEAELKGHRDKYFAQYGTIVTSVETIDAKETFLNWIDRSTEDSINSTIWGVRALDSTLPLRHGSVILIAGYTGAGKSVFAQNIAIKNLKHGNRVAYFNLKESSETVLNNMISAEALIPVGNIYRNLLTAAEWQRLSAAIGVLNIDNLKFVPFQSNTSIQDQLLATVKDSGADLVIVDDVGGLGIRTASETEAFMYQLKNAAAFSDTVVILLSNLMLKKFRFDDRPVLSDFETDSIYRFCDIVQFVYRNTYDDMIASSIQKVEIITAKSMVSAKASTVVLAALPDHPIVCELASNTTLE